MTPTSSESGGPSARTHDTGTVPPWRPHWPGHHDSDHGTESTVTVGLSRTPTARTPRRTAAAAAEPTVLSPSLSQWPRFRRSRAAAAGPGSVWRPADSGGLVTLAARAGRRRPGGPTATLASGSAGRTQAGSTHDTESRVRLVRYRTVTGPPRPRAKHTGT